MATPSEIHNHFKKGEKDMNDKVVTFKEYQSPEYWMKRRARRAFIENVGPVLIVLLTAAAYGVIGYLQGCL